jgi:cysteine synthase B
MATAPALPWNHRAAAQSPLDLIGRTPLIRLDRIDADLNGVQIWAKAEFLNPGGSVKDRAGLKMIIEGEQSERLTRDRVILDSTSGNTGIAYAMIGAYKGYKVKLCLPSNASPERKQTLKAYGAEMILTDPGQGSDGAILKCREIYNAEPDAYFYPDQYNNPANPRAHYEGTAVEILEQTGGAITHFLAALGTSGTFVGCARRFRAEHPRVRCISAQPVSGFHGLEGLKHMPTAIVPGIYDDSLAHENLWLETEDAHAMARRLARQQGLLVGISAGANVHAAWKLGQQLAAKGEEAVIVTILCDGASKYLSDNFWNE